MPELNTVEDIVRNTVMKETELNREEAKEVIMKFVKCSECHMYDDDICKNCEDNYSTYELMKACKRAYLEMEKLDKIELGISVSDR